MTLYLEKDSIYPFQSRVLIFFINKTVNLFRTNNPISKSPYFNSFHNMDMYFDISDMEHG